MFDFLKRGNTEKVDVDEFDIICPKCMLKMDKVMRGDIILDVCKVCGGTWFDKDEVEKLFLHLQNEQKTKDAAPVQKQEPVKKAVKKTNSKKK